MSDDERSDSRVPCDSAEDPNFKNNKEEREEHPPAPGMFYCKLVSNSLYVRAGNVG